MTADVNRQWLLKNRPEKDVEDTHFELVETAIPRVAAGQILVRNLYLAFEPAQRGWLNDVKSYMPPVQIGEPMRSEAVGRVVETKHPGFQVGDYVAGSFGWQDYAAVEGDAGWAVRKVPEGTPITYPLHVYGVTGMTAYFGMQKIAKPKEGDVFLVSGAAGATGSVAGQIARLKGCRVIGIAGGERKCAWLKAKAKFDEVIDYKNESLAHRLREVCGNSINIYFDNVGGEILDAALVNMAQGCRVVLCGGISSGYYKGKQAPGPSNYMQLVIRRSRMEGFIVTDYQHEFESATREMQQWIDAGQITVLEDIDEGFESAPRSLQGLFTGKNFGKQLLKIADVD